MTQSTRFSLYLAVLALPFLLLTHLNSHLELDRFQNTRQLILEDEYHLPSSDELAVASLNYRTAAADILWVGALLYASEQRILRQPRRAITEYADAIIGLDPHFLPIYHWHHALRYEGEVNQTIDDLEEANRILALGLKYFPDQWPLAQSLVMNHISHRFERSQEERITDLEEALYYARLGARAEDAPPTMTTLAIGFQYRLERVRQGLPERSSEEAPEFELTSEELDFLVERYFAAEDDRQRDFLLRQLLRLGGEEELMARIQQYDHLFRSTYIDSYPYLSSKLFLLVDSNLYVWHDQAEFEGL